MEKNISIILSTYNEKSSIEFTINEILKNLPNAQIVIVDDDSPDGTFDILKKFESNNIKIYNRKKNKGLATAFLTGLINTDGDVVGWLDSNMGSLSSKFPEMITKLDDYDIVLLSRYIHGGSDDRNFVRVFSSKLINYLARFLLRSNIKDLSSGIFVMNRRVLLDVVPVATGHGEFFVEFLSHAEKKGNRILEIPYIHPVDLEGNSKSFPNIFRFLYLGFFYIIRLFQTIFRR
tara:strand:+ start:194 stop:892 length:699 start_codon:yes stop_codon:yes gene_type:complete